ncbi:hypothetical protein OESDEN_14314 [Oesophagostomum dentatum]|uniref:Uncharacterized protein n=1 Tax=Oesophagostomum dentatum TaxID=61180 RepID=A0A0B1SLX9_OESDE|nr:hypothetical protein OESDEN_14314 [Oesophagostomum dentatum]
MSLEPPVPAGFLEPQTAPTGSKEPLPGSIGSKEPIDYNVPDDARQNPESFPKDIEQQLPPQFAFDSASVRAAFVRKVFALVTLMILIVIAMVTPAVTMHEVRLYMMNNTGIYFLAFIVFTITYFIMICCTRVTRTFPCNLLMLGVFTLASGGTLMVLCASVPPHTVLLALSTTAVSCIAIIGFASQTKYDITSHLFLIFTATFAVFIFGITLMIMSFFIYMKFLHIVFSAIVCVLFMFWLAIDTQMIIGGRRYEISPEDYIFAALMLFIDLYEIFITLLRIFNGDR